MDFVKVIIQPSKKNAKIVVTEHERLGMLKEQDICLVDYYCNRYYGIQDVVIGYPGNIQLLANIEDGSHEIMDKNVGEEFNAVILPNGNLRLYPVES